MASSEAQAQAFIEYQKAVEQHSSCRDQANSFLRDIDVIVTALRDGALRARGDGFEIVVNQGIRVLRQVRYPSAEELSSVVTKMEAAEERLDSARRGALEAGVNLSLHSP